MYRTRESQCQNSSTAMEWIILLKNRKELETRGSELEGNGKTFPNTGSPSRKH